MDNQKQANAQISNLEIHHSSQICYQPSNQYKHHYCENHEIVQMNLPKQICLKDEFLFSDHWTSCFLPQQQEWHQRKTLNQHAPRRACPAIFLNSWLVVCLFSLFWALDHYHHYLASNFQSSFLPAHVWIVPENKMNVTDKHKRMAQQWQDRSLKQTIPVENIWYQVHYTALHSNRLRIHLSAQQEHQVNIQELQFKHSCKICMKNDFQSIIPLSHWPIILGASLKDFPELIKYKSVTYYYFH